MSEVRLIDADKLKEELKQYFSDGTLDSVSAKLAFNMILRKIDEAQTVKTYCYFCGQAEHGKIEERPQGEWVDYSNEGYVECPFCGSATNCEDNKDELHYCWNCGAEMKGGAE